MEIKTIPVEKKPEDAGTQVGVETKEPKAPEVEVDFLSEYEKLLEENKRLADERDNYKKIGLRRKRGEDAPEELTEDEVERRAEERALEIVESQKRDELAKRKEDLIQKALKENRELKTALKNRSQIVTAPSGTSSDSGTKATEMFFTPEQLADLKRRGIDPEKVKANYFKYHDK